MSENKCCGNCARSYAEDMDGYCVCGVDDHFTSCDEVCDNHTMSINGWTEITPDNVEGLYDVDPCRLMIATIDSHGNPQYAKYDGMSTTLDAMATIGGCYSLVLPELRLDERL